MADIRMLNALPNDDLAINYSQSPEQQQTDNLFVVSPS